MKDFIDMLPAASPALIAILVLIIFLGIVAVGGFVWMLVKDIISNLLSIEGLLTIAITFLIIAIVIYIS